MKIKVPKHEKIVLSIKQNDFLECFNDEQIIDCEELQRIMSDDIKVSIDIISIDKLDDGWIADLYLKAKFKAEGLNYDDEYVEEKMMCKAYQKYSIWNDEDAGFTYEPSWLNSWSQPEEKIFKIQDIREHVYFMLEEINCLVFDAS